MAKRPTGYEVTAEVMEKKLSKYDAEMAQEVLDWLSKVSVEPLQVAGKGENRAAFLELLKDGTILLKVMNIIRAKNGQHKLKINNSLMSFKMMENIGNFLEACQELGVSKFDLFQTVDLYEGENISQVVNDIYALGRKVQILGLDIPHLGPSLAQPIPKEFHEDQLKDIFGLQIASNNK